MARKVPDNYIPVKARIVEFRSKHPSGSIKTTCSIHQAGEDVFAVIRAEVIAGNGNPLASGQSICVELGEDKAFEKAESVAIGRALVHAGYSDLDDSGDLEDEVEVAPKKSSSKLGGSSKPKLGSPKKAEVEEESEAEEEEVPRKKSKLPIAVKKVVEEEDDEVTEEDLEGEPEVEVDDEDEDEPEEETPKPKKVSGKDLLAKFRNKD